MPELPDLQIFRKNLAKKLVGKKLHKITIRNQRKLKVSPAKLKKAVEGEKLTAIERIGKELHFCFSNDQVLGLHLMLRGDLHFFDEKNTAKFTIVELLFDGDVGLAMTDYQGQATPTLNPEARDAPDALSSALNLKYLKKLLSDSKAVVKNVLLDQHAIRGIGNAYADEILWHAKISPFSISNKIPTNAVSQLLKSIKSVLKKAEQSIVKTHPDIISGEVRDFMLVHHAKKERSPGGSAIQVKKNGSRKTYYTDEQVLYS